MWTCCNHMWWYLMKFHIILLDLPRNELPWRKRFDFKDVTLNFTHLNSLHGTPACLACGSAGWNPPTIVRTNVKSMYCKVNRPCSLALLHFTVNTTPILSIFRAANEAGHGRALLKMSCAIDILSALYHIPYQDDTWLVWRWGVGTLVFYIYKNVLTMCSGPAVLLTKWITYCGRWGWLIVALVCGAGSPSSGHRV